MKGATAAMLLLFVAPAMADDHAELHVEAEDGRPRLHIDHESTTADRVPLLSLDPVITSRLEGLARVDEREATTITYGKTKLVIESIASANVDTGERPALDVPFRSRRFGARISHDFGPVEVSANAEAGYLQMQYGQGSYRDIGAALTYRRNLSRWMHAWISLGVGQRTWNGEPPPGEAKKETHVMLTVGTTFR